MRYLSGRLRRTSKINYSQLKEKHRRGNDVAMQLKFEKLYLVQSCLHLHSYALNKRQS